MVHNNKEVLEYWNKTDVESMYDKYLIQQEIQLIKSNISTNVKILDAGCGEGEGTLEYAQIPGVAIHAADFSDTRIMKARERLKNKRNVKLIKVDFLGPYDLDNDYDVIVSQRFLINLMGWKLQNRVICDLRNRLKKHGFLLLLEGSKDGVNELNLFRKALGLDEIPIKWHNLFFKDSQLEKYLNKIGMKIVKKDGLGEYFFLTRGLRPFFDKEINWDSRFNHIASSQKIKKLLSFGQHFSRLKLWVAQKL